MLEQPASKLFSVYIHFKSMNYMKTIEGKLLLKSLNKQISKVSAGTSCK